MFDVRRIVKIVSGFVGGTFAASWAALAPLVVAFKADLAAGEQAAIAGAAAAAAGAVALVWQWVRQLLSRARGYVEGGKEEAVAFLGEAEEKIAAARDALA